VLDCVTQCSQSAAHLYEQFLQVQQIGFVTLGLYTVHRGGCLKLYYCNMVEWFWWDSSLILTTNWFPSLLWHCWFGHPACKNRPRNDLLCIEWDVKPYTLTHSLLFVFCFLKAKYVSTDFYYCRPMWVQMIVCSGCVQFICMWRVTKQAFSFVAVVACTSVLFQTGIM